MKLHTRVGVVLGSALTWMLLWALIGVVLAIVIGILHPPSIDEGEGPIGIGTIFGTVGAGCGLLFGLLIQLVRHGRPLAETPLLIAAFWGAVAGFLVPLVTPLNDVVVFNTNPLGALAAVVTVALARARRPAPPASATA